MAHFVQEKALGLVPIWKVVKDNNLLSHDELTDMIRKVNELEENFQRHKRDLSDLRELIDYLVQIQQKLEEAVKAQGNANIRKIIKNSLSSVVGSRFEIARRSFNSDIAFWKYWVQTYMNLRWYDSVDDVYDKCIQTLGQTNADIWIEASFYPFQHKGKNGMQESRRKIQECLRVHRRNLKVLVSWYSLELRYMIRAEQDLANDPVKHKEVVKKQRRVIGLVYSSGKESLGTLPTYYMQLLRLLCTIKVTDAKRLKKEVKRDFETNCSQSLETYDFLALVHLDPTYGGDCHNLDNIWKCFGMYSRGIKVLPTQKMFDRFIAVHSIILRQNPENRPVRRLVWESLRSLCAQGHERNLLQIKDYDIWIDAVRNLDNEDKEKTAQPYDPSVSVTWPVYFNKLQLDSSCLESQSIPQPVKKFRTIEDNNNCAKASATVNGETKLDQLTVINLALSKFPSESRFISEKLQVILGNPMESAAKFYEEVDTSEVIINFMKQYSNVLMDDAAGLNIWKGAFMRLVTLDSLYKAPDLIFLAGKNNMIQVQLAKEYLRMLYGEPNTAKQRRKFLKNLIKSNQRELDPELIEFLTDMDTVLLFQDNKDKHAKRLI